MEVRLGAEPETASADRAGAKPFAGSRADSAPSPQPRTAGGPAAAPVARTVYLQAPAGAAPQGSMAARLAIVYLASFALTTVLVLGVWTNARAGRRAAAPPAPEIRVVEKLVEVPVPVPAPSPVEAAAVEPAPVVEVASVPEGPAEAAPEPPAPRAAPSAASRARPTPKPTPPAPIVAAPEPAPVVEPVAPAPAPPPPAVPPSVMVLSGTYSGKGKGAPLSITFTFGPDGKLSGRVSRDGGPSLAAAGTYRLLGDKVSFVLLEASGADRVTFSGTLAETGGSGRMALGREDIGKFTVAR